MVEVDELRDAGEFRGRPSGKKRIAVAEDPSDVDGRDASSDEDGRQAEHSARPEDVREVLEARLKARVAEVRGVAERREVHPEQRVEVRETFAAELHARRFEASGLFRGLPARPRRERRAVDLEVEAATFREEHVVRLVGADPFGRQRPVREVAQMRRPRRARKKRLRD